MSKKVLTILLFIFFFLVTFILYYPTGPARFVFDFVDLISASIYENRSPLFSPNHFLVPDFVARSIIFLHYQLFGGNSIVWLISASLLHAGTALLVVLIAEKIMDRGKIINNKEIAFFSGAAFCFSPYQTEAFVWGGAMNYLLVGFFSLSSIYCFIEFCSNHKRTIFIVSQIFFIAALFSHELGIFLIPVQIVLYLYFNTKADKKFVSTLIFSLVLFFLYTLNRKGALGSWVGHYGVATHFNFATGELVVQFSKYLLKIIVLFNFYDGNFVRKVYTHLDQALWKVIFPISYAILFLMGLLFFRKKNWFPPVTVTGTLFTIFLFPVLNLYFPYQIPIQGDRYCYLPSAFIFIGVFILLFEINKYLGYALSFVLIIANIYFLSINISYWSSAAKLESQLESNFSFKKPARVFILNLPDNFNGAYMYRSLGKSSLAQTIKAKTGKELSPEIFEVLSYNLKSTDDSVMVSVVDSATLHIELSRGDNWWWRHTKGATDFENEMVKADVDDWAHSYTVRFKNKLPEDIFIYQAGVNWRKVNNF